EAWAVGAKPWREIWHGGYQREGLAGHDPEDPFDGLPHDARSWVPPIEYTFDRR
ncbi:hypothetical protein KI387_030277, partial [Taxus chinensis]